MEKLLDDLLNKIIMRSWNLVIILFVACLLHSCDNCNNTELTSETKEWMEFYQNNEYSIFSNGNKIDTLFISDFVNDEAERCSNKGDCFCENIAYWLLSNKLFSNVEARDYNIFSIVLRGSPKLTSNLTSVNFNTEERRQETISYYNLDLIQFDYKNQSYESLKITCDQCNEVYIKRMVISKDLGILEYEDEFGNVWVKQ